MPRKKEFDPEVALEKAMRVFWENGYFDTSIRDLIEKTGVNFYGLYSVFGDKHGVYLRALDLYKNRIVDGVEAIISKNQSLSDCIEALFKFLIQTTTKENGFTGCMVCNATIEVAPHDKVVAQKLKTHRGLLEKLLSERLDFAVSKDELGVGTDVKSLSEFIVANFYTIGLLARSGSSLDQITRYTATAKIAIVPNSP